MKFAVKYSKNALGWSHLVPQLLSGYLMCAVPAQSSGEQGRGAGGNVCSWHLHTALAMNTERQSGLTDVASVPHSNNRRGSWMQMTLTPQVTRQSSTCNPGHSLLGFPYPWSSSRSLRQSAKLSLNHQVILIHSVLSEGPDCLVQSEPRQPVQSPALPVPSPACCVPSHPTDLWKMRCAPWGLFSLQLWLTSTKQTMTRLSAAVLTIFFFPLTAMRFFTPFILLPTCTTHILSTFFLSLVVFIQVFGSVPFPE